MLINENNFYLKECKISETVKFFERECVQGIKKEN
jgi:hypothetical protein